MLIYILREALSLIFRERVFFFKDHVINPVQQIARKEQQQLQKDGGTKLSSQFSVNYGQAR